MNSPEHAVALFVLQIAVLLLAGRLLGEAAQRVGQPPVMGQLVAGILLGPSILGALAPAAYTAVVPTTVTQKAMVDGIAQFGVLLLLLLSGMETDLRLLQRIRRTAFFSSACGMVIPFVSGFFVAQMLPDAVLPNPQQRTLTALFVATCLAVSSVKIVAMIILDSGFQRRNLGQLILATAVVDDTVGWITVGAIAGAASRGAFDPRAAGVTIAGTLAFLVVSFTLGRRLVGRAIRWTNDNTQSDFAVTTLILLFMCGMALLTEGIGIHTSLGAFVAGILVGQSPLLSRRLEEQLRGPIVALFAPVFFTLAGRSIDLRILGDTRLLALAGAFVGVACAGKLLGGFLGGRLGGLRGREAVALALGMNARGSTEVVVATIGLTIGLLSQPIFTLIVIVAITTTIATPPLLKWALGGIPPRDDERERLEREAAEKSQFVPHVERILAVTEQCSGDLALRLAGLLAGARQISTTVLPLDAERGVKQPPAAERALQAVKASAERGAHEAAGAPEAKAEVPEVIVASPAGAEPADAVLAEAAKGYDIIFLGMERPAPGERREAGCSAVVERVAREFEGAVAIAVGTTPEPLRIMVAVSGTDYSRRAAEVAVAIAQGARTSLTVLHVSRPSPEMASIRFDDVPDTARAVVRDIEALARRERVPFRSVVRTHRVHEQAILREVAAGRHNLLVLGVNARPGDTLFLGETAADILARAPCALLLVKS
ncbi:MAG TPA: cation:proton antiporter [Methylomirabilota bacterium]|nr:cation:proton antiporter [Methylomirabilota bacterium]